MRDPANLSGDAAQSQPSHRRLLSRHVPPAPAVCPETATQGPSQLQLDDLDASLVGAFLEDLENCRRNRARSRNLRLTAIRSFFRYASLEAPAQSGIIQRVLAIPNQRQPRALVGFLTRLEIDALLAAPDRTAWLGRRDYAFLITAVQTGCLARSGSTCALSGQGTKGTLYAVGQTDGRGPQSVDSGTRRRFQNSVSQRSGWTFERRRCSTPARTPRGAGTEELRFAAQETRFATCSAACRCHGVATGRCRISATLAAYLSADGGARKNANVPGFACRGRGAP